MNNDMNSNESFDSLVDLLDAARDGTASPSDLAQLNALLKDHGMRQAAARLLLDESLLREELTLLFSPEAAVSESQINAEGLDDTRAIPVGTTQESPGRWLGYGAALLAASLMGVVCTLGFQGANDRGATGPVATVDGGTNPSSAGSWSNAINCSWASGSQSFPITGREVRAGEQIALLQGVAELELLNGAKLKVDGPTAMVVTSGSSFIVQHGSVLGDARSHGSSLEVAIPSGKIHVRDGEFGLKVFGDHAEVHAFSSDITISLSAFGPAPLADSVFDEADSPADVALEPGESVYLEILNEALVVKRRGLSDQGKFVSARSLSSPLSVPNAYVRQVVNSKPMEYWRFGDASDLSDSKGKQVTKSAIPGGQSLKVTGNVVFRNELGNTYVDFTSGGWDDLLLTDHPIRSLADAENYSLEFWMRPNHLHVGMVVGLIDSPLTDPHAGVVVELQQGVQLRNPDNASRIRFLHRTPPTGSQKVGTSCYSSEPYALRQWQHVVASKQGKHMRLYVNAELTAEAEDTNALSGSLHFMCGQLHREKYQRAYVGQLDEVALYPRALKLKEIQKHFDAAPQGQYAPKPTKASGV